MCPWMHYLQNVYSWGATHFPSETLFNDWTIFTIKMYQIKMQEQNLRNGQILIQIYLLETKRAGNLKP